MKHFLACVSVVESIFLFCQEYRQITLGNTMVNACDLVLNIADYNIQPMQTVAFITVINMFIEYCL